ncbi:zinc finger protein 830 [Dermacentor albipictus]|uniref:zinc finger protein 830 n=1 Tax=Dermacentor albipictus TaxID=60249 RepID=UPI0031FC7281
MAAPAARKKVIQKDDLKRLMRERKEALSQSTKKITSPYAKYNSLGQLTCSVCMVHVKSETLWAAHVLGKAHKQNVEDLKESAANRVQSDSILSKRRNDASGDNQDGKNRSLPGSASPPRKKTKGPLLMADYSSDEDMDVSATTPNSSSTESALPKDFFDKASASQSKETTASQPVQPKPQMSTKKAPAEVLPEGFFDDPVLDAKARNVEYKDPIEEEWEKFKKEIAEETTVSEAIMAEDIEESKVERDIEEIDEQIHNWQRVDQLQQRKEELMKEEVAANEGNQDSNSDLEDEEYEEFLSWRAKGVWKE